MNARLITVARLQWFHMRYKQGRAYTAEAYSNDSEYFRDVALAYAKELKDLYAAGLRNVQFDDPGLACEWLRLNNENTAGADVNRFLLQVIP